VLANQRVRYALRSVIVRVFVPNPWHVAIIVTLILDALMNFPRIVTLKWFVLLYCSENAKLPSGCSGVFVLVSLLIRQLGGSNISFVTRWLAALPVTFRLISHGFGPPAPAPHVPE